MYICVYIELLGMKFSKDLIAASSSPIILSILTEGDCYGYQIIKKVKEISEGNLEWADGMLYPVLHKLEEKGMISSYWKVSDEGRKRKYYTLLDQGKITLTTEQENWSMINLLLTNLWKPNQI